MSDRLETTRRTAKVRRVLLFFLFLLGRDALFNLDFYGLFDVSSLVADGADEEGLCRLLEDLLRVELPELFGRILARAVEEDLATT